MSMVLLLLFSLAVRSIGLTATELVFTSR